MEQNVGPLDSVLRVALGFALLFTAFIIPPPLKWFAYAGFLVFAITGFVGRCPLYRIFGIRTCRPASG
jgi:hypothetical protein